MVQLAHMRSLRRAAVTSGGRAHYMHIELEGNGLRRITSVVAASLIAQLAVDSEVAGHRRVRSQEFRFHRECVGIDVELLAGIERKRNVLAGWERNACGGEVAWRR